MEEFRGRVAVVTGAASGFGFALAERAANEGMTVVLSDIEEAALEAARASLADRGFRVLAHRLDVSIEAEVEALADRVFAELGAVHLLCNNAGVIHRPRPAWEHSVSDWRWVLAVNLWGVVHGIRAFVPRMLASGEEGHVVNTSSMAGLVTGGTGTAVYDASKHAVLSLSESLYKDLVIQQTKVSASVLCPGAVTTNIFTAERNRPPEPGGAGGPQLDPVSSSSLPDDSFPPADMADQVFAAVRENRFYVLAAQPVMYEWTKMGHDRMWEGKNPAVPRRLIAAREAGQPSATTNS
jgi:NAD(P)-dependent dehydrogenase (short-subunit alcohol dehydrogenase family)